MKKQKNKQGIKASKLAKAENKLKKQAEQIITVKNAEGEPDTQAKILIQNKINYTPKVSVIIPVYNVEEYLRECLDSVINQTLKEIEIICVDDGSTDNSLEILKEYAKKDNRISVLSQENLHAGVARNAGLAVAKGEYLSFLDSDDFFELNMLEETYKKAKVDNADIVIYDVDFYNNSTCKFEKPDWIINQHFISQNYCFSPQLLRKYIFNITNNWPWNKLFKGQYIREHNIYYQNTAHTNDTYFVCISLALASRISVLLQTLLHYRINVKHSLTTKGIRNTYPYDICKVIKKIQKRLQEEHLYHLYEQSFINLCCNQLFWNISVMDDKLQQKQLKDKIIEDFLYEFPLDLSEQYFYSHDTYKKYMTLVNLLPFSQESKQILKEYTPQYKYISFDIFDTLLLRPYKHPLDLFLHMEQFFSIKNFANIRIDAEKKARKMTNEEEITIDDIYNLMPQEMQFLKQKEIAFEEEEIFVNKKNRYLYNYLMRKGIKIILTSDMYLNEAVIARILDKNDIRGYYKIYLSSSIKKTKRTGTLFRYICQDLDIKEHELIHLGDNELTDKLVPETLGIKSFMVLKYKDIKVESYINNFIEKENTLSCSTIASLIKIRQYTSEEDYWYQLGYNLGGPISVLMFQFIEKNVKKEHIEELLFIARDGYILEKVYNILSKYPKNHHYIYASRGLITNTNTLAKENVYKSYLNNQNINSAKIGIVDLTTINLSAQKFLTRMMENKSIYGIYWLANKNTNSNIKYNAIFYRPNKAEAINFLIETLITAPHPPVNKLENNAPVFEKNSEIENKRCQIYQEIAAGIIGFATEYQQHFSKYDVELDEKTILNLLYSFVFNYTSIDYSFFAELSHSGNVFNTDNVQITQYLDRFVQKKISIIISVYNGAEYLRECLNSVINQTLKEIEIICINDGSTDNSLQILKEYAEKDKRIILVNQENQGLSCSRNNALKIAKGKYIQFVDADDIIRKDMCEKLYKTAERNNLDMLCFLGYNFVDNPKNKTTNLYWSYNGLLPLIKDKPIFCYKDIMKYLHKMIVSSCLTLYRNEFIKKNNIEFPPHLCFEDNVFYLKALINAQRISIDCEEYYYRRVHSESITQNWSKHFTDYLSITDLVLQYLKDSHIDNTIFNNYKKSYIKQCVNLYHSFNREIKQKNYDKIIKLLNKYHCRWEYAVPSPSKFKCYIFFINNIYKVKYLCISDTLLKLKSARLDIKNFGNKNNAVEITASAKISQPIWFANAQGIGHVVETNKKIENISIKAIQNGKLCLDFRGQDKRFEGTRFPVWIDYKSIKIDGKEILSAPIATWHDKPFRFEMPVKDGQVVKVEVAQQYHQYSKDELKDVILKFNPNSDYINEHINKLTNKIYNKIVKHESILSLLKNKLTLSKYKPISNQELLKSISRLNARLDKLEQENRVYQAQILEALKNLKK